MSIRKFVAGACLGVATLLAATGVAQAQQNITRIIVPFAPGGGTDVYVRLLASELPKHGLQVIVENKQGASGIVAADYVAHSKPDGRTVLLSSLGILASNVALYDKLPYDPQKDFAPVTQIAYQPAIIVGRTDLPYRNVKEMVDYAKKNPGKINRGSPGATILTNLAALSFEKKEGFQTTHVPFNGDSPALLALLSGSIDVDGTSITGPLPYIRSGKMRVLGVMDSKRLPQVPDAPTFKEMGFNVEAQLWYSLSVPANTPRSEIDRLNKAVNEVIADPKFVEKAREIGMEPLGGTPEQLGHFIKAESERWLPVLQALNIPKQH